MRAILGTLVSHRQCLEAWLRKDVRYGDGNFRHGFYPVFLRREAIRPQQPTALNQLIPLDEIEQLLAAMYPKLHIEVLGVCRRR